MSSNEGSAAGEQAVYRRFVCRVYHLVYHMPEYATASDWKRLFQPVLEVAAALLGDEETTRLKQEELWHDDQHDDEQRVRQGFLHRELSR